MLAAISDPVMAGGDIDDDIRFRSINTGFAVRSIYLMDKHPYSSSDRYTIGVRIRDSTTAGTAQSKAHHYQARHTCASKR